MSLRTAAVSALVVGSTVLPLLAPVALQYEGGASAFSVLAGVHGALWFAAARLTAVNAPAAGPRVDFSRATA